MLARSEAVLYWLGSGVAVAFIGLVVLAPERVDRTMMDILTRILTAVGIGDVLAATTQKIPAGSARTYSTLIILRLTIFTAVPGGQQSLCSLTSWDNPLLYAWTAAPTAVSKKAHRGHLRRF
jgi:hypothetical protein